METTLILGDCLDRLRELPDSSVRACVTDPPYGLFFMGSKWDVDVPGVEVWREVLRVLKPGGHLLAFFGTRTYHRGVVAIEDAGFEIRDQIGWAFGSGFPKSLDVGKAIDKLDAAEKQHARQLAFTAWVRSTGVTASQIDAATGTRMGNHYTSAASQPAIMTREHLEACRHLLGEVPAWVERECDVRSVESENFKRREVLGTEVRYNEPSGIVSAGRNERTLLERNITAPATPEAQAWQGWGTALKPAWEPIVVARKPIEGTVAANVLEHGTGGINVDGCRVGVGQDDPIRSAKFHCNGERTAYGNFKADNSGAVKPMFNPSGRWPANLIHDGSDEVVGLFPVARSSGAYKPSDQGSRLSAVTNFGGTGATRGLYSDSGSAARFFYCAKASKRDREEGLADGDARANHHPTVKPTDLMRYLCRLVTPPGGVVLDPFMGSGSTGKAAVLEGFSFVGIEREAEYHAIAEARIRHVMPEPPQQLAAPAPVGQLTLW